LRPRIKKNGYRRGDVIRATLPGTLIPHICIILEDERPGEHVKCLPVCNLTGSRIPEDEYSIDISKYDLPNHWFEKKKTKTWLRCNEIDCVHILNINSEEKLGNILKLYPDLWGEVCLAARNCPIAKRLASSCECENEIIDLQIRSGKLEEPDCGCE